MGKLYRDWKKNWEGKNRRGGDQENDTQKDGAKEFNMPRNNILLQRLTPPRRIQLPNGRVVFAKYKRVNRYALVPTQVRINRTYVRKIGPR